MPRNSKVDVLLERLTEFRTQYDRRCNETDEKLNSITSEILVVKSAINDHLHDHQVWYTEKKTREDTIKELFAEQGKKQEKAWRRFRTWLLFLVGLVVGVLEATRYAIEILVK